MQEYSNCERKKSDIHCHFLSVECDIRPSIEQKVTANEQIDDQPADNSGIRNAPDAPHEQQDAPAMEGSYKHVDEGPHDRDQRPSRLSHAASITSSLPRTIRTVLLALSSLAFLTFRWCTYRRLDLFYCSVIVVGLIYIYSMSVWWRTLWWVTTECVSGGYVWYAMTIFHR